MKQAIGIRSVLYILISSMLVFGGAAYGAGTSANYAISDSGTTNGGTTSSSTSFQLRGALRNEAGVTGKSTLYAVSGGIVPGIQTFVVTFASGANGSVTGATSQTITSGGSTTTVTAEPAGGFHFVNWTDGATEAGTTAALTISNVTAAHSYTANFVVDTPAAVNGACGPSDGGTFTVKPTTNLCTTGTASAVTGSGPWSWNCNGTNGGTDTSCNAAIDITGPTLVLSTLADGAITINATLNISGTASDTSNVRSLTINNLPVTVTNGSFSHAVTLQADANTITTVATDTLGNSTTVTRTITLDQTAPVLTIATPADNSKTAQGQTTITGTVSETSTVTVKVNNGTPQNAAITGNSYSASTNLDGGLNTITITATDLAGNTASAVRTVTYDSTNPSLAITSPNQDSTVNQNSLTISGTVSDTVTSAIVTVTFNNQTYTPAITNGAFSQQLTIPTDGTYAITVTAIDEAGNSSSATRNVIYAMPVNGACGSSNGQTQGTAPAIDLCTTGTSSAITGSGPWNWTCSGSNGGTDATCSTDIQNHTITFTSGANGTVTGITSQTINYGDSTTAVTAAPAIGFHFVNWTEGTTVAGTTAALTISNITAAHSYTANFAIDPVNGLCGISDKTTVVTAPTTNLCITGTASAVTGGASSFNWSCGGANGGSSASCSAAIDISAPSLTVSTLANNATTTNATLNVAGTVSDSGSGVKSLTVNGTSATIAKDGSFSVAITLVDGVNSLIIVATDSANNQATDTRTITLDRTAPGLAITLPADNSITGKNVVEITGSVDDANSTVSARINNGTASSATMSGTAFSSTLNLASGLNTIYITATDLAGNSASAKRSITSDTLAPTLAVSSPAQDANTTQSSLTLSGSVTDSVTSATVSITVDGQTFAPTVAADGNFSQIINLQTDKTYTVVVTATDQAGNIATAQRNIIKGTSVLTGDMTGDGKIDISDAYMILEIAVGRVQPTASDLKAGDVAPLVSGTPAPDGVIDVADVVVILRKIVGLVNW